MKKVDLKKWKRASHYQFYKQFKSPYYSVTQKCNLGLLYEYCKAHNIRPFSAYLYASQLAAHSVDEFRYRITNNEVIDFEQLYAGPTAALPDDTFRFTLIKMEPNFGAFEKNCEAERARVAKLDVLNPDYNGQDIIYYTTLPWMDFTSMSNPHMEMNESIPRITFGKMVNENGEWKMAVCVEANHALIDGIHIARYFEKFESLVQNPQTYLKE